VASCNHREFEGEASYQIIKGGASDFSPSCAQPPRPNCFCFAIYNRKDNYNRKDTPKNGQNMVQFCAIVI
jgi:hypothetical protein